MSIPFLPKMEFFFTVALLLMNMSCASSPAHVSPKTRNPPVNGRKVSIDDDSRNDFPLVGMWQGFWSLKGKVETDRFLFLEDGRWGWLATASTNATNTVQPVQRSGLWEMDEGIVVLTELQRKEIIGCKPESSSGQSCKDEQRCEPCSPEYRIVRHDTPVIERLAVDECPDNREAKTLDREYTCLSIGERIFWRKTLPVKREQDHFFEGQ